MGVNDVSIIGVGKDIYIDDLDGMVNGRILPWVEDVQADGFPVWTDYGAVQRSTYFLNRDGELIYQFNITSLDPTDPEDYEYLVNLILNYRAENGPEVHRIPEEMNSIQNAIEYSDDGDIVLINSGTYYERIDYLDKNITVASMSFLGGNNIMSETIIDGEGLGTVITIAGGQDQSAILLGLTVQNGSNSVAAGGILIEGSNPTIDRNIIRNNHAGECGGTGGGIAILDESYPYLFGNEIYNNDVSGDCDCICYFGGGIYVDETSFPIVGGSVTIGNALYDNYADYGMQLFRDHSEDTTGLTPIFAHYNNFESCPPEFPGDVYPENGWDLEYCNSLEVEEDSPNLPREIRLNQNYPNPFNPKTTIGFTVAGAGDLTSLQIYNIQGRLLEILTDQYFTPGHYYEFEWDGSNLPSGLYFIQLRSGKFTQTKKAILVK